MKYRKCNRSKQVSGGCSNNNSCSVCRSDRTHSTAKAEPIEQLDPEVERELDEFDAFVAIEDGEDWTLEWWLEWQGW